MFGRPLPLTAAALALALTLGCPAADGPAGSSTPAPEDWAASIEAFRQERETRLRAPDGWLSLVGLAWLTQGENRVGSDPALEVVLPEGSAPPWIGTIVVDGDRARWSPNAALDDDAVRIGGEPATSPRELRDDRAGEPDRFQVGRVGFHLIRRGDQVGVRIKDPRSETLSRFEGLVHYPIDPAFRIEARLEPFDPPREVQVEAVAGGLQRHLVPGRLRFEIDGRALSLEPFLADSDEEPDADVARLFIIFKDRTSGAETYGAGRYLYADLDRRSGTAILDFNRAYNPPCAYTPFATCPLPRPENRLDVPIRAGERVDRAESVDHR